MKLYDAKAKANDLGIEKEDVGNDIGQTLLESEKNTVVEQTNNSKVEGIDGIHQQIFSKEWEIVRMCKEIYITGEWPHDI